MSLTVDYFFNHSQSLAEIAERMNKFVGCSLSPYENNPDDLFCLFLAMELSLMKNELENDGALNFEDYLYHLSLRTPVPRARFRGLQIPAMAYMAYVLYFGMEVEGMLVYDGQFLLARYEGRFDPKFKEDGLYDLLSNDFVRFPSHLEILRNRLPEDWRFTAYEA